MQRDTQFSILAFHQSMSMEKGILTFYFFLDKKQQIEINLYE